MPLARTILYKRENRQFIMCAPNAPLCLRLDRWAGLDHVLASFRRVLLEVLVEEPTQLRHLRLEAVVALGPGVLGVQQFRGDACAGLGHGQVECVVVLKLHLGELARVDSVEDGTGIFQTGPS